MTRIGERRAWPLPPAGPRLNAEPDRAPVVLDPKTLNYKALDVKLRRVSQRFRSGIRGLEIGMPGVRTDVPNTIALVPPLQDRARFRVTASLKGLGE